MNLAKSLVRGIFTVISNINPGDFNPSAPPPPCRPLNFAKTHENEEEKNFRQIFEQLAGDDMEICPEELKGILDRVFKKRGQVKLRDEGFSVETCRSLVAVMDSDSTGKLGFHEFKYLWNNIKKWENIFKKYDRDRSGSISGRDLPGALADAGFRMDKDSELFNLIVRRYADQNKDIDFDCYLACLVRLDTMSRTFQTLDEDKDGNIELDIEEWLQLTMYS